MRPIILLLILLIPSVAASCMALTEMDLQSAINVHAQSGKPMDLRGLQFEIRDHVYLYGNVQWIGGEFEITGKTTRGWAIIHCGTEGYGHEGHAWTGSIEEAQFVVRDHQDSMARVINIHRAEGAQIKDCEFDLQFSGVPVGAIAALNHANFCKRPFRKNIAYLSNRIIANQGALGSEGLNVSSCDGVRVEGNSIHGMGDDPIGLHDVSNFSILDNDTSATDGRVYVSGSSDGIIARNRHRHTTDTAGSLIQLERERDYQRTHPLNITIENNDLFHFDGGGQATYGIRVRGGDGIKVLNNRVYSDNPDRKWGIRLEPQKDSSTHRYPDGVAPVLRHQIVANACPDIREFAIGSRRYNVGPVVEYGNAASEIKILSPKRTED